MAKNKSAANEALDTDGEEGIVPTVRMVRNPEQYPEPPHAADVHVDEVDNWAAHGWMPASAD